MIARSLKIETIAALFIFSLTMSGCILANPATTLSPDAQAADTGMDAGDASSDVVADATDAGVDTSSNVTTDALADTDASGSDAKDDTGKPPDTSDSGPTDAVNDGGDTVADTSDVIDDTNDTADTAGTDSDTQNMDTTDVSDTSPDTGQQDTGPPPCQNGKYDPMNGETDLDCGGPNCTPCSKNKGCQISRDCQSEVCNRAKRVCAAPTCSDGAQNGNETDVDCGGSCKACPVGDSCAKDRDCASGICQMDTCAMPTCMDGVKNGMETDIDCGGPMCGPCPHGKSCRMSGDCTSGVCQGNTCKQPTCSDSVQNGNETDVDCGGNCSGCSSGNNCNSNSDCLSGVCQGGTCQAPTCSDGVKNQSETDVDCGGTCGFIVKSPAALKKKRDGKTVVVSSCIQVELNCLPGSPIKIRGRQSTGFDSGLKVEGDQVNFSDWETKTASDPGKKKFDLCRVQGRKPTEVDWLGSSPQLSQKLPATNTGGGTDEGGYPNTRRCSGKLQR